MFLQLDEFLGLLAALLLALLLLLLVGGHRLAFTENFLKRPHLGKEHVPESPPHLAFITMIFSPEIIVDELVDLHPKLLQCQLGGNGLLGVCRRIMAQLNGAHFAASDVVA